MKKIEAKNGIVTLPKSYTVLVQLGSDFQL